jgi:hypothetical protein
MRAIPRLSASLAVLVFSAGVAAAEPAIIGAVDKVQARVDATQAGQIRSLELNSDLYFRDRCQSGEGARLQATLKDGTQLTLGEHATLVIDEFIYDPMKSHGKLAIRIARGAFLYVGGLIEGEPGAKVRIRTPAAALGVRGTTVWGGPIDRGFGVLALSGEVTVTGRRGTVALKQGEGTMIFADGKPRPVVEWPADKLRRALATIAFGNAPGRR